jgi:histidyl-tRNA synthetase
VEEMGGPSTPGYGFAIGMERLALLTKMKELPKQPSYFFAYVGDRAKAYIVPMLRTFVKEDLSLSYSYEGKSLKSQMRYADSLHADFVFILGDEEIGKHIIVLRDMRKKIQFELPLEPLKLLQEVKKLISQ